MHQIVMWLGGIVAAIGVLFFVMIALIGGGLTASSGFRGAALLSGVMIGGGLILSGAVLYCFGAIVEHLIGIRAAAERQVEILDKLGKPKV